MVKSYSELTLFQFSKLLELYKRTELSDIERQTEKLSILSGMSPEELMKIPIVDYKVMSREAQFIENTLPRVNRFVPRHYSLGGFKLVPTMRFDNMTLAQSRNIQLFSKGGIRNIAEFMSCLLVPKGMEYNVGYNISDVFEAIRDNLSVNETLTLFVYYWNHLKQALSTFLIYSKYRMKRASDEEKASLSESIHVLGENIRAMGNGEDFYTMFYIPDIRYRDGLMDETVESFLKQMASSPAAGSRRNYKS